MPNIQISVQDQRLTATPGELLVAKSVGEVTFEANFDDSWDGYTTTIIFTTPYIQKSVLYGGGMMTVPWEALARPTDSLRISAVGVKEGHRRPTAHMRRGLAIVLNGAIEGGPPQEYSPALWEQVLARLDDVGTGGGGGGSSAGAQEAQAKAEEAQRKAEAAQTAAEAAAEAAESSNQAAAQEATKAAGEAGNAAQSAGAAADAQSAAQAAQGKAKEAQQAAEEAKEDAENAKNAAVAALESIPVPVPTGADDGKVPVARGASYRLEEIAVGAGGSGEAEIITDATLQEAAAYTWQGAGAVDAYRKIIIDIACPAQEANGNTANANIFGNPIATYYINAATKNNRKTTIEVEIINSSTAIFRRSGINTSSPDPMDATTYITVDNQLIVSASIDAEKPLLRIPAELPAGTRIRILGVRK